MQSYTKPALINIYDHFQTDILTNHDENSLPFLFNLDFEF